MFTITFTKVWERVAGHGWRVVFYRRGAEVAEELMVEVGKGRWKESKEYGASVGPMILIGRWESSNFQVPIG